MNQSTPNNPNPVLKADSSEKGLKFDNEKTRMELLPPLAMEGIARVFTFGAKKYSSWNWSKGMEWSRLYGSLMRHMNAWYQGEETDPESKESHLFHAGCCIMMLIELTQTYPEGDDRPEHYKK